jgi:drug/metabolite transporter (DMT)-like permease
MRPASNATISALGMIFVYSGLIGFADNYVRVVAASHGLWQFHATRSVIALPLIAMIALVLGHRFWPRNPGAVIARSTIHGVAMMLYFGALAFLPVAVVAAGLFTAPLFVLLISRFAFAERIRPVQILAVGMGFVGVVLLLGPAALQGATLAAILPILGGAMYAMGNIATRRWCADESAETLLAGFFAALFLMGTTALVVLHFVPVVASAGADGFVARGWQAPSGVFMFWVCIQAVVSVIGVGLMIRAYQVAPAPTVSVFEYMILPISAIWGLYLWGESLTVMAMFGMALIAFAGAVIAFAPVQSAIAARQ